jgi:hypothetical protein
MIMNEEIVGLLKAVEHIDLDDFISEGEKHPINRKVCPWCGGVKPDHFSYCRLKNLMKNLIVERDRHLEQLVKNVFVQVWQEHLREEE